MLIPCRFSYLVAARRLQTVILPTPAPIPAAAVGEYKGYQVNVSRDTFDYIILRRLGAAGAEGYDMTCGGQR